MAESRLRAPDLAAQLGVARCQGKCQKSSPDAGRQPLSGKSFYLDLPAGKNLQFLTGAIQQLGGVPLSRGKELLQKAIRNQGSSSSLLSNARSWGVRILHVDEMMVHVQQLSLEALRVRKHGPQKPEGTCPAESRTRKVARLKAPFLKVEDESSFLEEKKPMYTQQRLLRPEFCVPQPQAGQLKTQPWEPGMHAHPPDGTCTQYTVGSGGPKTSRKNTGMERGPLFSRSSGMGFVSFTLSPFTTS